MKVSKLIKELQQAIGVYGDVPIRIVGHDNGEIYQSDIFCFRVVLNDDQTIESLLLLDEKGYNETKELEYDVNDFM